MSAGAIRPVRSDLVDVAQRFQLPKIVLGENRVAGRRVPVLGGVGRETRVELLGWRALLGGEIA